MITIKNLFKNYIVGKEKKNILDDINLEIKKGEFVSILGRSGCGKSTLLNIVGGLDSDIEGQIYINNKNLGTFKEKDWTSYRKQNVGFVFQNFNLIGHYTALENIEFAMQFNGKSKQWQQKRAKELLIQVGLLDHAEYLPSQLSGGQKQRIAIARALANQPEIILADEPTGALDSKSSRDIMDLFHKINIENGVTIVMVTHNQELAKETDRIIQMKDGKVCDIAVVKTKDETEQKKAEISAQKPGKMSFTTAVWVGMKNLWLRKKRSLFTIVGTAVGITGMILMLGIGVGVDKKVQQELRGFIGDETIWVTPKEQGNMTEQDFAALKQITGVGQVLDNNLFTSTYYYKDKSVSGLTDVLGPMEIATPYEKSLAYMGELPKADDSYEILLSKSEAKNLLDENELYESLIGETVTVLMRLKSGKGLTYEAEAEFKVTGIVDSGLISTGSFIPYTTADIISKQSAGSEDFLQKGAEVRLAPAADYDSVVAAIRDMGYEVSTNKEDFAAINMMVMALKVFLVLIATVALFVSVIMIKIVLHTNVLERTQEIGIMCAIGAGKKDVRRIFVVEAGLLGLFAGIIGIVTGQLIGMGLNSILKVKFSGMDFSLYQMRAEYIVFAFAVSVLIAAWAGRKPAKRAAKLSPVEALRYE